MRLRYLFVLVISGLLSLGLFTSTARAGGDVTVCDEAHLRSALSGGGLVTFSCSGVITLSSPVSIVDDTTIDGSGETVTISGDNSFNVLNIGDVDVTVRNLTIADGYGGSYTSGGGIDNSGNLVLDGVRVTGHNAGTGGAIDNNNTLTIVNSTVFNNSAFGNLGGLAGAIYNSGGATLTIDKSTFYSNHSNIAGAIYVLGGNVEIANSTFYYNTADPAEGGALYVNGGSVTIVNSTFAENSAGQYSDGSAIYNDGGVVTLQNTIVANSMNGDNCEGPISDGGGNLSFPDATCPGINLDPVLGSLQDNGGPTLTIALLDGSSAIDNGIDSICNSAPINGVDQRGVARPVGDHCDIGAYETDATAPEANFAMNVDPAFTAMCLGEATSFDVELLSVAGFSAPVDLTVSSLPDGTTATFDTNPVSPTGTTQLTITDTGSLEVGGYTLDVVGTSVTRSNYISASLFVYDAVPDVQPTLLTPADGAADTLWNPIFAWERMPGAIYYGLQVATDLQFTNIVYSNTVIGTTDTPYPSLSPGTQYFWRLNAWNACGDAGPYSEVYTFTTEGTTFDPTFTIEPDPDTVWLCDSDQAQYELRMVALGGFSDQVTLSAEGLPAGATANFSPNPVTPNAYVDLTISSPDPASVGYHAIEVVGGSTTITRSEYVFLNVKLPTPTVAPTLLSPTNGMTNTELMPTLSWEPLAGISGVTSAYELQVATDSSFNNIVYASIIPQTSRTLPTPLAENTQYFWRVKGFTQCGEGPFAAASTFTTGGGAPTFTLNANPPASWACLADAAHYDLTVTGLSGFDSPVTLSMNDMEPEMNASFSVNPVVPTGTSELTVGSDDLTMVGPHTMEIVGATDTVTKTLSLFLEVKAPAPDAAPTLLSPTDGMTDTAVMPTVSWEGVDGATSYVVEVATDSGFNNVVYSEIAVATDHTLATSLDEGTQYFWRVTPENDCGLGPVSAVFSFTTTGQAPPSDQDIYLPLFMAGE